MRKTLAFYGLMGAAIAMGASTTASAGDAEAGKAAFATQCGICHQVGPNAQALVGPALNGIAGKKAGSIEGYALYSPGMKKLGEDGYVWSDENLDAWIKDPKALLPTSTMSLAFAGVPNADDRANIIAYLKTYSE